LLAVARLLFLSVCDKPNSSEATKKDRGFFAGKLEPVNAKNTTLIQPIFLACEDENQENFQADMGTERFADPMDG
jgi:hypothetical protein